MTEDFFGMLCCPHCLNELEKKREALFCVSCRKNYEIINGIPVFFRANNAENQDSSVNHEKWSEFWHNFDWEAEKLKYDQDNTPFILKYLTASAPHSLFLEIGSGPSFLSFYLAEHGFRVVCVDFDLAVLEIAKKHFERHGVDGFFVCADIIHLPLRSESIDISAGIGVIEHSRTIEISVRELFRVAKGGGYTFQTVPALSLLTFTLNQRHGVMPRLPILRELFSFLHTKILGSRLMKHGYEEEFTEGFLRRLFLAAGFSKIESGFYDYNQTIARKIFGNVFRPLIKLRPFWDLIYVRAYK